MHFIGSINLMSKKSTSSYLVLSEFNYPNSRGANLAPHQIVSLFSQGCFSTSQINSSLNAIKRVFIILKCQFGTSR